MWLGTGAFRVLAQLRWSCEHFCGGDPGWLVPRDPGQEGVAPLGLTKGQSLTPSIDLGRRVLNQILFRNQTGAAFEI